jgi:HK97 family phage prohead protease
MSGKPEIRAGGTAQESAGKFSGYAAVFGPLSNDLGGFVERIDPAAFDASLKGGKRDIRALFDHSTDKLLGRQSNGTLALSVDERGLRVEIDPPDGVSYVNDIRKLIARGDINQMSFGFYTDEDSWDFGTDGLAIRTLKKVTLVEVSIVSIPAYNDTSIGLRRLQEVRLMDLARLKRSVDLAHVRGFMINRVR